MMLACDVYLVHVGDVNVLWQPTLCLEQGFKKSRAFCSHFLTEHVRHFHATFPTREIITVRATSLIHAY